jgi:glutaconate CoA-transferase subunit A
VDVVVSIPGGAYPSYALGYSSRDDGFYAAWDGISRDREGFLRWMADHGLPPIADG